jgi:hypothetical protein
MTKSRNIGLRNGVRANWGRMSIWGENPVNRRAVPGVSRRQTESQHSGLQQGNQPLHFLRSMGGGVSNSPVVSMKYIRAQQVKIKHQRSRIRNPQWSWTSIQKTKRINLNKRKLRLPTITARHDNPQSYCWNKNNPKAKFFQENLKIARETQCKCGEALKINWSNRGE